MREAVRANNFDKVQQILQTDEVDVNARNSEGTAALHLARDKSIAHQLINKGAEVNLQDDLGFTPLLVCVASLSFLRKETSSTGGSERFTHHGLSNRKLLEVITLLLEAGASPNIPNNLVLTVFICFSRKGVLNSQPQKQC